MFTWFRGGAADLLHGLGRGASFATMESTIAVQRKGLGFSFHAAKKSLMAATIA